MRYSCRHIICELLLARLLSLVSTCARLLLRSSLLAKVYSSAIASSLLAGHAQLVSIVPRCGVDHDDSLARRPVLAAPSAGHDDAMFDLLGYFRQFIFALIYFKVDLAASVVMIVANSILVARPSRSCRVDDSFSLCCATGCEWP